MLPENLVEHHEGEGGDDIDDQGGIGKARAGGDQTDSRPERRAEKRGKADIEVLAIHCCFLERL